MACWVIIHLEVAHSVPCTIHGLTQYQYNAIAFKLPYSQGTPRERTPSAYRLPMFMDSLEAARDAMADFGMKDTGYWRPPPAPLCLKCISCFLSSFFDPSKQISLIILSFFLKKIFICYYRNILSVTL